MYENVLFFGQTLCLRYVLKFIAVCNMYSNSDFSRETPWITNCRAQHGAFSYILSFGWYWWLFLLLAITLLRMSKKHQIQVKKSQKFCVCISKSPLQASCSKIYCHSIQITWYTPWHFTLSKFAARGRLATKVCWRGEAIFYILKNRFFSSST